MTWCLVVSWCTVDAETGQVKVDILFDSNCWTNKHCLLDILVRIQVSFLLSEIGAWWDITWIF